MYVCVCVLRPPPPTPECSGRKRRMRPLEPAAGDCCGATDECESPNRHLAVRAPPPSTPRASLWAGAQAGPSLTERSDRPNQQAELSAGQPELGTAGRPGDQQDEQPGGRVPQPREEQRPGQETKRVANEVWPRPAAAISVAAIVCCGLRAAALLRLVPAPYAEGRVGWAV